MSIEWPSWRRDLATLGGCLALGWIGLARGARVPLLALVDLGFHELGHLVCYILRPPELVTAAAGSIAQVAVPVGLTTYFLWRRHDRAGEAVCLAWAATSAANVAVYIADAPYERLELIGGEHDWAFIMSDEGVGRMGQAAALAGTVRGIAWVFLGIAVVIAAWPVLTSTWRSAARPPESSRSAARI